jgi:very-short-patch-repair endonuclease
MKQRRTIASFRRDTARRLRANATGAEERLWRYLRRLPVYGTHFRRQVPIGPYVADFACMAARLIVEVDGSQHGRVADMRKDADRTRWLKREGYRVLRFWNNDVTSNIKSVLEVVRLALDGSSDSVVSTHERGRPAADHPTPARFTRRPSPSRGG